MNEDGRLDHGNPRRPRRLVIVLVVIGCAGCHAALRVPTVPAAGTITYRGKPIETGEVVFFPAQSRPAHGRIEDGRFQLMTYRPGDGAVAGAHRVAVIAHHEGHQPGGPIETEYLVPEKYAHPETSGITITIPPQGQTAIAIALP